MSHREMDMGRRGIPMPPLPEICVDCEHVELSRNSSCPCACHAAPLFYIMNRTRPVGNSVLWWKAGGSGYTCDITEAWKVTRKKAEEICRMRPPEDIAMPTDQVDRLAESHVHVDALLNVGLLKAGWLAPPKRKRR